MEKADIKGLTVLAEKATMVILDESFIRSGNVQRLCAKRRFTLGHECAHQILFQLESEEEMCIRDSLISFKKFIIITRTNTDLSVP